MNSVRYCIARWDTLNEVELETVHRVILRMRMEQSLDQLDTDEMRENGVMDRLPQIIAEVRSLTSRSAGGIIPP